MPKTKRSLSIKSLIWNDYASIVSLAFPLVVFSMTLFIEIFGFFPALRPGKDPLGIESIPFFLKLGVISLIIGVSAFYLRYKHINSFFINGEKIEGKIQKLLMYRDRGNIFFSYDYKEYSYQNNMAIHQSKKVKSLREGDKINVLINKDNPLKAIIEDIFI